LSVLLLGRLVLGEFVLAGLLLDDGLQSLKSGEDFHQLRLDGLPACLTRGSGHMSRVCRVGLGRSGVLSDAHQGCHGQ
jgi:hypothetical protein